MARLVYALFLGLFGALLVHILTIFMIPQMADNDAWARLSGAASQDGFAVISRDDAIAASMRSFDPNFVIGACRISLADGAVSISGEPAPDFWSLSVYNRQGANLFSVNDRSLKGGLLDVVVATPLQLIEFQKDMPPELSDSVFAEADMREGFVILRAFVPNESQRAQAAAFVTSSSCEPL